MEIDRDSGVPAYQQLADWLRAAIVAGELSGRLPSARTLTEETGVSVVTARRALRIVADEGYARISDGLGVFTRPREDWPEDT